MLRVCWTFIFLSYLFHADINFWFYLISFFISIETGDIVKYFRVFDVHVSKTMDQREKDKIKSNLKLLGAKSATE